MQDLWVKLKSFQKHCVVVWGYSSAARLFACLTQSLEFHVQDNMNVIVVGHASNPRTRQKEEGGGEEEDQELKVFLAM